jgi:tetratricopeptide (TPR) repeat protein
MRITPRQFPLLLALVALVVYLLTLSHGATVASLGLTAKVTGWNWQPMVGSPLVWFFTLPLRVLPAGWIPLALNFFTALCAAVTLGILARSLELLPWLFPLDSLQGWKRRVPVLLAVSVCGLEFHFWQNATAATGEMLDVLLLAAAIWCALEFRANKNEERWLRAAAFIWGLGMAENWMMVFTLPLFVVGLVWLRVRSVLNLKFVIKLAGWGMAGFSVYALLPLANGLLPHSPWSLGESFIFSLKQTKQLLAGIYFQFWRAHRLVGIAVLIFYLVPVLSCLLRLPDEETRNKAPIDQFQIWIMRAFRAALLLVCLWLAFDPAVGPHGILKHQINFALPLLSFDYLNGLGAGFLAGNLLLICRINQVPPGRPSFGTTLERAAFPILAALLMLATIGLTLRNVSVVTAVNRQPLSQFGELALRSLPEGGGIILSDFPDRLASLQLAQARHANSRGWLAVDVRSLPSPDYREQLERQRPGLWMLSTNRHNLAPEEMMQLAGGLVRSNRVFYLHPSFGFFFEAFYLEPSGLIFELKPFQTNSANPPALTAESISQTEKLWDEFTPRIESLQRAGTKNTPAPVRKIERKLHLDPVAFDTAPALREWYSMALNGWGVELQRGGRLAEAQRRFVQSLDLNTNNWIARANLFCNSNLQAGKTMGMTETVNLAKQLGSMQNYGLVLGVCGPVDEPELCYLLGDAFSKSGLPRQAIQQFKRAETLAPDVLAPRLALASLYARYRLNAQALEVISQIRGELKKAPESAKIETKLSLLEAEVCLSQTNLAGARQIYQSLLQQNPEDSELENSILQAYVTFGDYTSADALLTRMLSQRPDDLDALFAKSGILLRTGRAADAIPILNQILSVTNSVPAKLNRATAYMQATNYAAAKTEFQELQGQMPNPFFANLGLGELALRQRDTNLAVECFTRCLSNAPPASAEWRTARSRLDSITAPARNTNVSMTK